MIDQYSETQYSRAAKQAYLYVLKNKMNASEAWKKALEEISEKKSIIEKGCPRATFIGLCESGDLKGIDKTKQSESHNYNYAKFAIQEWKKDNTISKAAMWKKVREHFPAGAKNHQGQLDVVMGVWNFLK